MDPRHRSLLPPTLVEWLAVSQGGLDEPRGCRPTRQFWTGVTYATDREAGEDTGRLNQQTLIPVPGGPLKEINLAAAIRRALQG